MNLLNYQFEAIIEYDVSKTMMTKKYHSNWHFILYTCSHSLSCIHNYLTHYKEQLEEYHQHHHQLDLSIKMLIWNSSWIETGVMSQQVSHFKYNLSVFLFVCMFVLFVCWGGCMFVFFSICMYPGFNKYMSVKLWQPHKLLWYIIILLIKITNCGLLMYWKSEIS